jgi:protein-S-isoprenylcysteine O-methyltransferase Ste14
MLLLGVVAPAFAQTNPIDGAITSVQNEVVRVAGLAIAMMAAILLVVLGATAGRSLLKRFSRA